ncbi:MAG: glycosyltransferase family 4 protein [Planctomycetes bacterium]|nr:glycosyltransferase family 4 protein [Planctomycetota bacterium]MBI3845653.1 glycosyltransferase family 4 protein [Planctomycetota bacterium]
MARVGIDVSILATAERTGVERYQLGLLEALARTDGETSYFLFSPEPVELPFELPENFQAVTRGVGARLVFWRETQLPSLLKEHGIDVFHSPVSAIPIRGRAQKIATVHEVPWVREERAEKRGGKLNHAVRLFLGIKVAAAIITPSQQTASDIERLYPDTADRICVIYPGVSQAFHPPRGRLEIHETLSKLGISESPYFLFVGTIRKKKNVSLLLDAFSRVAEELPEMRLVFVGKPGDEDESVRARCRDAGLEDRVTFAGYVDDADLPWLYGAATAVVYPSASEGFGFPVVEAFACGTPVIASDAGSIPEVASDAALVVPAGDLDALAKGLVEIVTDGRQRRFLIDRGLARARDFSWEACAERTMSLYRQLAGE